MKKLKWGMIGGGEGSQIGPAHRLGSGLDGFSNLLLVHWTIVLRKELTMVKDLD